MSAPQKAPKATVPSNKVGPKQIAEGAAAELGKKLAASLTKARGYEAAGEKKFAPDMEKADEQRALADGYIAQAREMCSPAGLRAFMKMYAKNLKRSRLAELWAIASGKKTAEQSRAAGAARQAKHMAKLKSAAAKSPSVTDTSPVGAETGKAAAPQRPIAPLIQLPAEDSTARRPGGAALAAAPEKPAATTIRNELLPVPPAAEPEVETPARATFRSAHGGQSALDRFKAACDECLPSMNLDELVEAEKYFRAAAEPIRAQLAVDADEPTDGSIPSFLDRRGASSEVPA